MTTCRCPIDRTPYCSDQNERESTNPSPDLILRNEILLKLVGSKVEGLLQRQSAVGKNDALKSKYPDQGEGKSPLNSLFLLFGDFLFGLRILSPWLSP